MFLLTVANLRGIRESGRLFAVPTYGFIAVMLTLIGWGLWRVVPASRRLRSRWSRSPRSMPAR